MDTITAEPTMSVPAPIPNAAASAAKASSQDYVTEHARAEAEKLADLRVAFLRQATVVLVIWLFFVVAAGFQEATIIALIIGIFLAPKGYNALIAPELKHHFVHLELERRRALLTPERRELESKHARSLEELSASIAHEVRNPITAAKSLVQQIGEDPGSEQNQEYAKIALEELDRVERSIAHLLKYAREVPLEAAEVSLGDVVESALETFKDRLSTNHVAVEVTRDGTGTLVGDAEKLRRIVINLVSNALDELEADPSGGGKLWISTGENLAGTEVWLKVKDDGPGIPAERLAKIWSPFFTTKANGTGLGLAITKKLVDGHCGTIEVRSTVRGDDPLAGGTEFTVTIPKGCPT